MFKPKLKTEFEIYRAAMSEEIRDANKTNIFQRLASRLTSFWDWYELPILIFGGVTWSIHTVK